MTVLITGALTTYTDKTRFISLLYTNAENLNNKMNWNWSVSYEFDIFIITEIFLKNIDTTAIHFAELNISGYNCFTNTVS